MNVEQSKRTDLSLSWDGIAISSRFLLITSRLAGQEIPFVRGLHLRHYSIEKDLEVLPPELAETASLLSLTGKISLGVDVMVDYQYDSSHHDSLNKVRVTFPDSLKPRELVYEFRNRRLYLSPQRGVMDSQVQAEIDKKSFPHMSIKYLDRSGRRINREYASEGRLLRSKGLFDGNDKTGVYEAFERLCDFLNTPELLQKVSS